MRCRDRDVRPTHRQALIAIRALRQIKWYLAEFTISDGTVVCRSDMAREHVKRALREIVEVRTTPR